MPPASRVEIIVNPPSASVQLAQLITQFINTGPLGDEDPYRPISTIQLVNNYSQSVDNALPASTGLNTGQQLFAGVSSATVTTKRTLYFSEDPTTNQFFITVVGQTPEVFNNNNPPSIVTTQGSVEEWTIQNRAQENHEFHMHQIHFLVESQDNFQANGSQPEPAITGQFADMIEVPFWDGNTGTPFPSVKLLMDFHGMDVGDFVYHCHILGHEDLGMMAIIEVLPQSSSKNTVPDNNRTDHDSPKKHSPAATTVQGAVAGGGMQRLQKGDVHRAGRVYADVLFGVLLRLDIRCTNRGRPNSGASGASGGTSPFRTSYERPNGGREVRNEVYV
jgi:uncharacterized cupredoxin-like copper-binding protein